MFEIWAFQSDNVFSREIVCLFFFPSQMYAISSWIDKVWGGWGKELGYAHMINTFLALVLPVSVSQMYSWHKETLHGESADVKDP